MKVLVLLGKPYLAPLVAPKQCLELGSEVLVVQFYRLYALFEIYTLCTYM